MLKEGRALTTCRLSDSASKHIAKINVVAASAQPANPFVAQRLIHASPDAFKPDRPFGYQNEVMRRNDFAVALLSQKFGGTIESTKAIVSSKPAPNLDPTVNSLSAINAAAHARNQTSKDALKLVLPELERRPNDIGLLLVITQLYVLTGNFDQATILLEKFLVRLEQSASSSELDVRYAPGLVGTLISLYTARSQTGHARRELAKAAKYWRSKSKNSTDAYPRSVSNLLKAAGAVLLDSLDQEDANLAKDIFTSLHTQDDTDRYASAGLIASLANTSPSDITESDLTTLTPVDRLIASIDASALESAGVAKTAPLTAPTTAKRPAPTQDAPKKAKKIKPSRLPKDYDPNKQPDPERWLPLKDRSTYRPKGGKKGKARQNMLAQGAVEDAGSRSASRPGTPVVAEKAGAGGKGGGQNKKKKGKGGKW